MNRRDSTAGRQPSSSRARASSSALRGLPCQPFLSSMKLTPLPLRVRARRTVGRPFFPASLRAARILSILWPSMTMASQPKAANLRFRAARSCWCMVGSLWPSRLTSTTATRLRSFQYAAAAAASQTWPSAHSPSPMSTKVRAGDLSSRWARAMPDADGQPLAEGAGRRLDPGHARRGVTFEVARDLPQVEEALERDDPGLGVNRPQKRGGMSLGQDELVIGRVLRVLRVPAHLAEEETSGQSRPPRGRWSGVPTRTRSSSAGNGCGGGSRSAGGGLFWPWGGLLTDAGICPSRGA